MEGEALSALGAHPRQLLQLFNQPRHRLGIAGHGLRLLQRSIDDAGKDIGVHEAFAHRGIKLRCGLLGDGLLFAGSGGL